MIRNDIHLNQEHVPSLPGPRPGPPHPLQESLPIVFGRDLVPGQQFSQIKFHWVDTWPGDPGVGFWWRERSARKCGTWYGAEMIIHTKSQEQCSIDYLKLMVLSTCGRQTWPHWVPRGFFYSRPSRLHGASNVVTWTSNTLVASWQVWLSQGQVHSSVIAGRPQGRYYQPLVDNRPFCLNGRYSWFCGRSYIKMVDVSSKSLRMEVAVMPLV